MIDRKKYLKEYRLKNKDKIKEQRKNYGLLHKEDNRIRVAQFRNRQRIARKKYLFDTLKNNREALTDKDWIEIRENAHQFRLKDRFMRKLRLIRKTYSKENRLKHILDFRKKIKYYGNREIID